MENDLKAFSTTLVCTTVSMLVACGGGGGGGSNDAAPAAPTPVAPLEPVMNPVQNGNSLQVSAPAPTYPQGSGELEAFNYLQDVRTSCGFGAVNQNVKLDTASLAHAKYLLENSSASSFLTGHFESPADPFFTGNSPSNRASAAGYGELVSEILSSDVQGYSTADLNQAPAKSAKGLKAMRSLVNTVYHLSGALNGARSVGFGANTKNFDTVQLGVPYTTVHYRFGALLGSQEGTQLVGAGNVATYPCAATQDAEYAFAPATEEPNPFPEITDQSAEVGTPIYLRADQGAVLVVESYNLKDTAGATVAVRTQLPGLQGHEFFMVPSSKLEPSSVYTVNLKGSANGQKFERTFTFKTKA